MKKIYEHNIETLTQLSAAVYAFKQQDFDKALRAVNLSIRLLTEIIDEIVKRQPYFSEYTSAAAPDYITGILENVMQAQNTRDYILLADFLELQVIPMIEQWQSVIVAKEDVLAYQDRYDQNIELLRSHNKPLAELILKNNTVSDEYTAEPTGSGMVTCKIRCGNRELYLAGNQNPAWDARLLADSCFSMETDCYTVFGAELLYNANALLAMDVEEVKVFESDLNVLKLACRYGDMRELQTGRLKIHYDPDLLKFIECIENPSAHRGLVMHYPSVQNIKSAKIRERAEQVFILDSSIRSQNAAMGINFRHNVKNCCGYVDELAPDFLGKEVYLVAAGPSLDQNIHLLKKKPENSIILAVGTVFKKLLREGIEVDYVIVSDANKRVIHQIRGAENEKIPMLILSTAYKGFAREYRGDRYLICQRNYDKARTYAEERACKTYETGGSVMTTALDVTVRLGAARVIFMGLDLAYTNQLAHAEGTSRREHKGTENLVAVEDVAGNRVFASHLFIMYREWIERRIAAAKDVEFIDATEGGARIKGTRICPLSEILSSDR